MAASLDLTQRYQVRGINYVKGVILIALQEAFGSTATQEKLRWNKDEKLTKIGIWRSFPRRLEQNNMIVIEVTGGSADIGVLGKEEALLETRDTPTGPIEFIIYGGILKYNVEITIVSKSTTDQELITDNVVMHLRHLFRTVAEQLGLGYVKIGIGGERQTEEDNEPRFSNSVKLEITSQYNHDYPVALVENIGELVIQQINLTT